MSSGKPFVDRHDGAIILLDLLFAQSQVSHKGHIEVALNHPGVKLSEMGGQAKEDTWAERCRRRWLVAARRLTGCGLVLSVNDRRVIVISEFLVAACAGRSAAALSDVLSATLTDLDLAALRLLDERPGESKRVPVQADKQLAFFERAKPARRPSRRRTKVRVAKA